jgi:hypothetical protein
MNTEAISPAKVTSANSQDYNSSSVDSTQASFSAVKSPNSQALWFADFSQESSTFISCGTKVSEGNLSIN